MNDDQIQAQLIAEQIRRSLDLLRAEVQALRQEHLHTREMVEHRLAALERQAQDHEARLRTVSDGVTQFKVWSGLANGGSTIMAAVAFLRAWLGG